MNAFFRHEPRIAFSWCDTMRSPRLVAFQMTPCLFFIQKESHSFFGKKSHNRIFWNVKTQNGPESRPTQYFTVFTFYGYLVLAAHRHSRPFDTCVYRRPQFSLFGSNYELSIIASKKWSAQNDKAHFSHQIVRSLPSSPDAGRTYCIC